MRLSDFKTGWRLLRQDRWYSLSTVAGLAAGFLVCYVLLALVLYSFDYDAENPQAGQTYLVKSRFHFPGVPEQWSEQTTQALRTTILERKLGADVSMYAEVATSAVVEQRAVALPVTLVDPVFARFANVRPLAGNLETALQRPDTLVLTVASAEKLFGTSAGVVGKAVTIGAERYVVAALVANPPTATTIPFSALASSGSALRAPGDRRNADESWGRVYGRVYLAPLPGTGLRQLTAALQEASDRSPLHAQLDPGFIAQLGDKSLMDVKLVALRGAYLDPDLADGALVHGDRRMLAGLAALAALILALAAINYVNLATVRTVRRQHEIAMLKVMGARPRDLAFQFACESVLTTLAAASAGLLAAALVLPWFGALMNRRLEDALSWQVIALFLALALVLGILAGAYPGWIAARIKAGAALAGRGDHETLGGARVRRVLTVFQLASAMALTCLTLGIALQLHHVQQASPGFNAGAMLVVDTAAPFTPPGPRALSFIDAVRRLPGVTGAGQSLEAVGRQNIVQKGTLKRAGATPVTVEWKAVDPAFMDAYRIAPLAGRVFERARDEINPGAASGAPAGVPAYTLSASAARALGYASPAEAIGQTIESEAGAGQVIGVVPDIRYQGLRSAPQNVAYRLTRNAPVLAVAFTGSAAAMEARVEQLWREYMPGEVPLITRQDSLLAASYVDDVRSIKLLAAAALAAILIAAMGVYVLSAYSVQRRTREIVLHRLYGASAADIVRLLGAETLAVLGVAGAIGLPLALALLLRYLGGFVERTGDWGWAPVLACAIAALVVAASVLRGMQLALALRPVQALRT